MGGGQTCSTLPWRVHGVSAAWATLRLEPSQPAIFIVPFKARRCPGPRRDLMYARINRATDFIDAAVERGAAVYVHADVDAAPVSVDAEVGLCLCLCLAGRVLVQGVGDRPLVDWPISLPISLASSIVVVNYITGSIDL